MDIAGYAKGRGQGADLDLLTKALGVTEDQLISIVEKQINDERVTGSMSVQETLQRVKAARKPRLRVVPTV